MDALNEPSSNWAEMQRQARQVAAELRGLASLRPSLAVVLGSGFQAVARALRTVAEISYSRLFGFPTANVAGHAGKLLLGHLANTPMLVLSGRGHFYEGYSMRRVTFPIRVLAAFGIRDLVLTNAAGGINSRVRAGDFMLVRDHISLMPESPLRGAFASAGTSFIDLTQAYDRALGQLLTQAAQQVGLRLRHGIYLAVPGPSYETPAEIRAFGRLGAEAIGMSTVPEAIVARQCGLRVAAISCITNRAAGRNRRPLSHAEVLATGERRKADSTKLLACFAELYQDREWR